MTDAPDFKAIRARIEAATPGPWEFKYVSGDKRTDGSEWGADGLWSGTNQILGDGAGWDGGYDGPDGADEELIAHAPQDIADLLAYAERLKKIEAAAIAWHEWRMAYGGACVHETEDALFDAIEGGKIKEVAK